MPKILAALIVAAFVWFTPSASAIAAPEQGASQAATDFSAHRKRRAVRYHYHRHVHYWADAYGWRPYAGYGWQRPYYYPAYMPLYYNPYPIFPYGPWW